MIPWVTYGNYLKGILQYNDDKVAVETAKLLHINTFDNNLTTFKTIFNHHVSLNKQNVKDNIMHVSLNFHKNDGHKISDPFCKQIATEFLTEFGLPLDHPYIIYQHKDKQHPHLHLVVPMTLWSGKRLANSNRPAIRMQKICRKLEKVHNITRVGEGVNTAIEDEQNEQQTAGALQKIIRNTLKKLPKNEAEFKSILSTNTFVYEGQPCTAKAIERKNKKGVATGYSFIIENEKGQQVSKSIKGKQLNYSYNVIQNALNNNLKSEKDNFKILEKNTEILRTKILPHLNKIVTNALLGSKTIEKFTETLKSRKINIEFSKSADGSIFGWKFIETDSGITYKGSELFPDAKALPYKSFSYQQIKEHFSNKPELKISPKTKDIAMTYDQTKDAIIKAKDTISLIDLALSRGYKIIDGKIGSKWITLRNSEHDTIAVASNNKKYNYYISHNDTKDKGSIVDFVINRRIVTNLSEAAVYFAKEHQIPVLNDPIHTNIKNDVPKPFTTVQGEKIGLEDYIVKAQSLPIDFVNKHNNNNIHGIGIKDLSNFFHLYYGEALPEPMTRHNTRCTIYDLYDIRRNDNKVVGQAISNKPLSTSKSFKHLVAGSDKTYGAWYTRNIPDKPMVICESPSKALAHMYLKPDTGSAFATIGNPSREIVEYLTAKISNDQKIILGGDNDNSGQLFNFRFLSGIIQIQNNTKIDLAIASNNVRIRFDNNISNKMKSELIKITTSLGAKHTTTENNEINFYSTDKDQQAQYIYLLNEELSKLFAIRNVTLDKPRGKDFNDDLKDHLVAISKNTTPKNKFTL